MNYKGIQLIRRIIELLLSQMQARAVIAMGCIVNAGYVQASAAFFMRHCYEKL